jgi:hypothetical protein
MQTTFLNLEKKNLLLIILMTPSHGGIAGLISFASGNNKVVVVLEDMIGRAEPSSLEALAYFVGAQKLLEMLGYSTERGERGKR